MSNISQKNSFFKIVLAKNKRVGNLVSLYITIDYYINYYSLSLAFVKIIIITFLITQLDKFLLNILPSNNITINDSY